MAREEDALVQSQIRARRERDGEPAVDHQLAGGVYAARDLGRAVDVDQLRRLARQPQKHRVVRTVSNAGQGERAVKIAFQARQPLKAIRNLIQEKAPGAHGPDRVGARWTDADRKEVRQGKMLIPTRALRAAHSFSLSVAAAGQRLPCPLPGR